MTLSIITAMEIVQSNIVELSPEFDNTKHITYHTGRQGQLQNKGMLYQLNTDKDFTPPDWNATDEKNYKERDVLFKDGKVQVISSLASTNNPVQPEDYSTGVDPANAATNPLDMGLWTKRYVKIHCNRSDGGYSITSADGHTTHTLFKSGSKWEYKLSWDFSEEVISGEYYSTGGTGHDAYIYRKPASYTQTGSKEIKVYARNGDRNSGWLHACWGRNAANTGWSFSNGFVIPNLTDHANGPQSAKWHDNANWVQLDSSNQSGWCMNLFKRNVAPGDMRVSAHCNEMAWYEDLGNGQSKRYYNYTLTYPYRKQVTNTYQNYIKFHTKGWGNWEGYSYDNGNPYSGKRMTFKRTRGSGPSSITVQVGGDKGASGSYHRYGFHEIETTGDAGSETLQVHPISALTPTTAEHDATGFNSGDSNQWFPGTIVLRPDGNAYIKTNVSTPKEIKTTTTPTYHPVTDLSTDFDKFSQVGAAGDGKITDKKNYTFIEMGNELTITVTSNEKFDTLAFTNLICDTIDVVFKKSDGSIISEIKGYKPKNNRDSGGRLKKHQTTVILYSEADVPANGTAEITMKAPMCKLGGLFLGLSVDAGFTNLALRHGFIDYSPHEKDQWGNISYVKGARVFEHSGTVDIEIDDYDMINRLMISIGGELVIMNGSDSKSNKEMEAPCRFGSTMLVGRMSDYQLETLIEDDDVMDLATYSFKMTQEV